MSFNIGLMQQRISNVYLCVCQRTGALQAAPSRQQAQFMLFFLGVTLLTVGLTTAASAQGLQTTYNTVRISDAVNAILEHVEGSFGAVVMVAAGTKENVYTADSYCHQI